MTVTAEDGTFQIQNLIPGAYSLRLNAAGFRLLIIPVVVADAGEAKELTIAMAPDNFRRVDTVEVRGDLFHIENAAISQENLTGTEIRQTATVLADDPFRSVQTLPGVSASANNEFFAQFSVMGAPFPNVAVYIDDVVVSRPFHELPGFTDGASLSVLTSETIEEMNLMPVAYPARYGDAAGPRSTCVRAMEAALSRCSASLPAWGKVIFWEKASWAMHGGAHGFFLSAKATWDTCSNTSGPTRRSASPTPGSS